MVSLSLSPISPIKPYLPRGLPHSAIAALRKEVKGIWLIRLDMVLNLSPLLTRFNSAVLMGTDLPLTLKCHLKP